LLSHNVRRNANQRSLAFLDNGRLHFFKMSKWTAQFTRRSINCCQIAWSCKCSNLPRPTGWSSVQLGFRDFPPLPPSVSLPLSPPLTLSLALPVLHSLNSLTFLGKVSLNKGTVNKEGRLCGLCLFKWLCFSYSVSLPVAIVLGIVSGILALLIVTCCCCCCCCCTCCKSRRPQFISGESDHGKLCFNLGCNSNVLICLPNLFRQLQMLYIKYVVSR